MLIDELFLSPNRDRDGGICNFPSTIKTSVDDGILYPDPVHFVTKHLQQYIESDHFRVNKDIPKTMASNPSTQPKNHRGFQGDAMSEEGFWVFRTPYCQRSERFPYAPLQTAKGLNSMKKRTLRV